MKLATFSNALPRTFVVFLFALLFISILLDIAQSAAIRPTAVVNPCDAERVQQSRAHQTPATDDYARGSGFKALLFGFRSF